MALQISKYIIRHILSFYSKILSPCNHIMLLSVAQLYIFNVLTAKKPCPDEECREEVFELVCEQWTHLSTLHVYRGQWCCPFCK